MLPSCVKLMGSCAFGSLCLIVSHCLIKILVDSQWLADNKLKVGYFFGNICLIVGSKLANSQTKLLENSC